MTGIVYAFGSDTHQQRLAQRAPTGRRVLHIPTEDRTRPYHAVSVDTIVAEFERARADDPYVLGLLNFGRGTVINELEHIALAFDEIRRRHPELPATRMVGPSPEAARIFADKRLTHGLFERVGIPCAKWISLNARHVRQCLHDLESIPYPAIVKACGLSGGRGMRFVPTAGAVVSACDELASLGLNELLLCEYIEGIEVSFAVLRLGNSYMRFPACYKEATSTDLRHPDSKVKLAGGLREVESAYACIEAVMETYDISGFLYLEAIVRPSGDLAFIEGATRLSGNSVIEFGALRGYDFYRWLWQWIECGELDMAFENRLCIQNAAFLTGCPPDTLHTQQLRGIDWVLEAKTERLGEVPFSTDQRVRLRVSFVGESVHQARVRAQELATVLGSERFAGDIEVALHDIAERADLEYNAQKLAEGVWDDNVSWEFWLSSYLPPGQLCSAVFCVAMVDEDHVVLARTWRGWEMLGGHIERGESVKEALRREALEEGGFVVDRFKLFGFRRVLARYPTATPDGQGHYPFPLSYIPHFVAKTVHPLKRPTGVEVLEARSVCTTDLFRCGVRDCDLVLAGVRAGRRL
jgi:8-oxo-dGTP pyrophosphatase MutT (NUDIX family)